MSNGISVVKIVESDTVVKIVQGDLPGPPGATGPIGIDGPTGPMGSTGVQGESGFTGSTGPIGDTGEHGPTGATGAVGQMGATGVAGAIGVTGSTGPVGATGATGPIGATGVAGNVGATGDMGGAGWTGATGPSGAPGAIGAIGATGTNGSTGSTGATGPAGTGVPSGGSTSQILAKASATDFDTSWSTLSATAVSTVPATTGLDPASTNVEAALTELAARPSGGFPSPKLWIPGTAVLHSHDFSLDGDGPIHEVRTNGPGKLEPADWIDSRTSIGSSIDPYTEVSSVSDGVLRHSGTRLSTGLSIPLPERPSHIATHGVVEELAGPGTGYPTSSEVIGAWSSVRTVFADGTFSGYSGQLQSNDDVGNHFLQIRKETFASSNAILGPIDLGRRLTPDDSWAFQRVGDTYSVLVNGEIVGSITDATFPPESLTTAAIVLNNDSVWLPGLPSWSLSEVIPDLSARPSGSNPGWNRLSRSGSVAETLPAWAVTTTQTLTSGRLALTGPMVVTPSMGPIRYVSFLSATTAGSAMTNQWFCIVDIALNQIVAVTVDDGSTAWASTTIKILALTADWTPPAEMEVRLGVMVTGSTPPNLLAASVPSGSGNGGLNTNNTGLTDPLPVGTPIASGGAGISLPLGHLWRTV